MHLIEPKPCFHKLVAILLMTIGSLAACEEAPSDVPADVLPATPDKVDSTCGEVGVVQGILSGAINTKLDVPDRLLQCESMPRPDGEGVRLRFSTDVGDQRLAILIALPDLDAGETGPEFDSNVTISVEGTGRFFSTPNLDTCWTSIVTNQPLADEPDTYNVVGGLSCVGPLGQVNGDGFVDVQHLHFSGIGSWGKQ